MESWVLRGLGRRMVARRTGVVSLATPMNDAIGAPAAPLMRGRLSFCAAVAIGTTNVARAQQPALPPIRQLGSLVAQCSITPAEA